MARLLNPSEFFKMWGNKLGIDEETAQRYWEESIEFISEELANYGEVDLPYFCNIRMSVRGGMKKIPNSDADKLRLLTDDAYRIENLDPYYVLVFRPKEIFKDTARGKRVTRAEIKRVRSDYEKEKQKLENKLKQLAIKKRLSENIELMLEGNKEKIKERKKFNKLSKKKQDEILLAEASYWKDDLENMWNEGNDEDANES